MPIKRQVMSKCGADFSFTAVSNTTGLPLRNLATIFGLDRPVMYVEMSLGTAEGVELYLTLSVAALLG
jgi:hypothetical protein